MAQQANTAGLSRARTFACALVFAAAALCAAPQAQAEQDELVAEAYAQMAEQPRIDFSQYQPGTIVVSTSARKLHLVQARGEVLTYPVGVGRAGRTWTGTGYIRGKYIRPAWSPPAAIRRVKPELPDVVPAGSPKNPMGAAAMVLSVDQYAIHGTNNPSSIGGFVSFGCIRMYNEDVLDLYKRVSVGTRVVVLQ
jgi:lipoprotein-anchoring transpeptidase ErfK/SrfK